MSDAPQNSEGTHNKEIHCTANSKFCTLDWKTQGTLSSLVFRVCPSDVDWDSPDTSYNDLSRCTYDNLGVTYADRQGSFKFNDFGQFYFTDNEYVVVQAHDKLGELESNDLIIDVSAQIYNLESETGYGLASTTVGTCDLNNLGREGSILQAELKELQDKGYANGYILGFDRTFNYISGNAGTINSPDIIKRDNIWVYVLKAGTVCPLDESLSGYTYADCSRPITANEIVCVPSSPYCSDDGTQKIAPEDSTCSAFGGTIDGYNPDGTGKQCLWKCIDGKNVPYDCINPEECPSGTYFNLDTGNCDEYSTGEGGAENEQLLKWIIVAGIIAFVGVVGFILLIVILYAISKMK